VAFEKFQNGAPLFGRKLVAEARHHPVVNGFAAFSNDLQQQKIRFLKLPDQQPSQQYRKNYARHKE
jgi:hypothetical protein